MLKNPLPVCLIFLASLAAAPATTQPTETPLDQISWMVGQWTIDTHWLADGKEANPLKGRNVITWGPGKKFILCDTILPRPEGGEYTRYHDVFFVENGQLVATDFAYDGTVSRNVYKVDGPFLRTEHELTGRDGKPNGMILRQELEREGDNAFHWRVWLVKDGKPSQIMNGTWKK
jgi:hypothetical protein